MRQHGEGGKSGGDREHSWTMGETRVYIRTRCTVAGTRRLAHSVNKWHLSPSIALHFAFYALRSPPPGLCLGLCFAPSARLVPYVYSRVGTRVPNIPVAVLAYFCSSYPLSLLSLLRTNHVTFRQYFVSDFSAPLAERRFYVAQIAGSSDGIFSSRVT